MDEVKRCNQCGETLPTTDFWRNKRTKDGIQPYCKACGRRRNQETWAKGRSKYRQVKRAHNYRSRYDIDVHTADKLRLEQGGICAICKTEATLFVDHNHITGAVRGLICRRCNFAIGHSLEDPARLRAAAAYLEHYATEQPSGSKFEPEFA